MDLLQLCEYTFIYYTINMPTSPASLAPIWTSTVELVKNHFITPETSNQGFILQALKGALDSWFLTFAEK